MPGGLHPPPEVVGTWKPNYDDPEIQGKDTMVMEIVLLAISYTTVALRVWIRSFLSKTFGYDDILVILTMVPLTGMSICISLAVTRYGWDRHVWDIPPPMLYQTRKSGQAILCLYVASSGLTKVSILLFYRRLTSPVSVKFVYGVYAALLFVAAWCIASLIVMIAGCRPISAYWLQIDPAWLAENQDKFYCIDEASFVVIASAVGVITDFVVCILPLSLFMTLQISKGRKFALAAVFGVGFFLCICGILRLVFAVRTYYHTYDFTWSSRSVWLWTGIEAHMAIVCASVPALNHFFGRILKDNTVSNRLTTIATRRHRSGYDRTELQTNSGINEHTPFGLASERNRIQVVQEVHLDILWDKSYSAWQGKGRTISIEKEKLKEQQLPRSSCYIPGSVDKRVDHRCHTPPLTSRFSSALLRMPKMSA